MTKRKTDSSKTVNNDAFYFDRIHINTRLSREDLTNILPIDKLKKECRYLNTQDSSPQLMGYKTRLSIVAPTRNFFIILNDHLQKAFYIITYIEIAHDIFYPTKYEAEFTSYNIFRTIRKKYSRSFVYDEEKSGKSRTSQELKKRLSRGLFASRTFYSTYENVSKGTRHCWFKLVIYARYSKLNGQPCIHYEWRIKKTSIIFEKTGIKTIEDLLNFNFETFFLAMEKKYIVHEKLDKEKIGKVLCDCERKKSGFTKFQKLHIEMVFTLFVRAYYILSISDYYIVVKNELQNLDKIRGPKTLWWKKLKKLNNYNAYVKTI